MNLLTKANAKTVKGEKKGYQTYILHLAPGKLSGYEACPRRTKGCTDACLNTAGRGKFDRSQSARIAKTKWFFEHKQSFMAFLVRDITAAIVSSRKRGLTPVFRLNGTSDIPWEVIKCGEFKNVFERFPNVTFYDYTKIAGRVKIPSNYHITFSRSESNQDQVMEALKKNLNVAVVFDNLPATYLGRPVINGDENDLRFLDPKRCIVGLSAKGKAKTSQSPFIIRNHYEPDQRR